ENYIDLVTLSDQADMEELLGLDSFTYTESAWIGLKKSGSKQWRWALADPQFYQEGETEYRNWATKEEEVVIEYEDCLIPAGHFAYIGLFKDDYIWSDNSTSSFRNWDPDQPDESGECVAQRLRDSRLWDDQTCSAQKPFFCSACV
uniref:C-type lectin domain-containing protein n=1 Tax=Sinocyclocheilus grahami TaxID=75366 RepID=A0A672JYS6_SINGR